MPRPTRVLHLVTDSIRYDNLSLLAEHADRESVELTVASLRPAGALQADAEARGITSLALDAVARSSYPGAVLRLARELRRRRIDVLQTHLFDAQLVGLLAGRLARVPVLVMTAHHSHELPLLRQRGGGRLPLLADGLAARRLAHHVIAPSSGMAATLVAQHHVDPARITVVPHGFDVDAWSPSTEARARVRRQLGIDDRVVLGAIGRVHWIKGYPTLLEAYAPIAPARPDTLLLIVGGGGGDVDDLLRRATALGIADQVRLLGHREDIGDLLDATDLFVHAAREESFGLVIAEAMAKAKPIVTTRVGAATDLVDEAGGLLVPPDDPAALRVALDRALDRQGEWPAMGAHNQGRAQELQAAAMVARYEALYDEWLDGRHREGPT